MSTKEEMIEQVKASTVELDARIATWEGLRQAGEEAVMQATNLGVSDNELSVFAAVAEEASTQLGALTMLRRSARELLDRLTAG